MMTIHERLEASIEIMYVAQKWQNKSESLVRLLCFAGAAVSSGKEDEFWTLVQPLATEAVNTEADIASTQLISRN